MGQDRALRHVDAATIPWLIGGLGAAFLAAFLVEAAVFSGLDPDLLLTQEVITAFVSVLPFSLGVVYGGYWLANSGIEPERYHRALFWCLGGALAFLALNVVLVAVFTPDTLWETVGWLRATATWGGAGGLLAGLTESRAIQNAIEAERETLRASYLEAQQESIDYLNGLLRHEVLNTAQVITGYSTVLIKEDALDAEGREKLATIRRQSQDMTTVVEDIRLMIEAMRDEATLRPVDLSAILRAELQDVRDGPQAATVDATVPDDVTVLADDFLPRVFGNLFDNAIQHNDSREAHLAVTVETSGDRAIVRVADDGPGIPDAIQATLFERDDMTHSEYGLGLVLVGRLVDRYRGDVSLAETGPGGSTFVVELPLAEDDPPADERVPAGPSPARPPPEALDDETLAGGIDPPSALTTRVRQNAPTED